MLMISDIYIAYKPAGWCGLCGRAACRGRYAEGLYKGKGAGHPSVQTRTPCSGFAAWGATDVPLHVPLCGGRETHFEGFPLSTDCVSSCALCVYFKMFVKVFANSGRSFTASKALQNEAANLSETLRLEKRSNTFFKGHLPHPPQDLGNVSETERNEPEE